MAKILIVDDDPDIVEACRLFLQKEGFQVSEAGNRKEGMKQLAAVKPDLLILDVMMEQPDDGLAMAQEIRRAGNKVPILMLTSVGKVSGLSFGKDKTMVPVDEFVEKPVEPAALVKKVKALLQSK